MLLTAACQADSYWLTLTLLLWISPHATADRFSLARCSTVWWWLWRWTGVPAVDWGGVQSAGDALLYGWLWRRSRRSGLSTRHRLFTAVTVWWTLAQLSATTPPRQRDLVCVGSWSVPGRSVFGVSVSTGWTGRLSVSESAQPRLLRLLPMSYCTAGGSTVVLVLLIAIIIITPHWGLKIIIINEFVLRQYADWLQWRWTGSRAAQLEF